MGERRTTASSHNPIAGEPDAAAGGGDRTLTPASTVLLGSTTVPVPAGPDERHRDADLAPGTEVGPYVLDAWIARGGFGDVYRATHVALGAPRAVKVLHADLATTRAAILRFEREVTAIQRVSHPNVIAIEGFGQLADGRPWFAMELLDGMDLGAYLVANGRLAPAEALAILEPLAAALDAVHARGIVHRDLKPSNVFLQDEGGRRRVVLLDFGVARLLDESGPGLTASLQLIGTPAFMAPEQIRGLKAGPAADLYALGALVHAMLTGEAPFAESPDAVGQLQLHLHTKPPRVSSRAPVDPAFDDVVQRALSKHPERRPATAGALLEDLRRAARAHEPADEAASRAAVIYVSAQPDDASLDEPDDPLLADLDSILPRAAAALAARGLRPALEMGNATLFLHALPAGAAAEHDARAELLDAAKALHAELARRPGRDARIEVSICLHAGPLSRDERGSPSGPLLDVAAWVPDPAPAGVLASGAMLAGTGHAAGDADDAGDVGAAADRLHVIARDDA